MILSATEVIPLSRLQNYLLSDGEGRYRFLIDSLVFGQLNHPTDIIGGWYKQEDLKELMNAGFVIQNGPDAFELKISKGQ